MLEIEEMNAEREGCLNTVQIMIGAAEDFWRRRGLRVRVETGTGGGRSRLPPQVILGSKSLERRELDTRRAPWGVCLIVMGSAIQFSCEHRGLQNVPIVAIFLASRSCEVCVSVFIQT